MKSDTPLPDVHPRKNILFIKKHPGYILRAEKTSCGPVRKLIKKGRCLLEEFIRSSNSPLNIYLLETPGYRIMAIMVKERGRICTHLKAGYDIVKRI